VEWILIPYYEPCSCTAKMTQHDLWIYQTQHITQTTHTYIYTTLSVCMCLLACEHACMCVWISCALNVHMYGYACIYMCTCVGMGACVQAHVRTYFIHNINVYMHVCMWVSEYKSVNSHHCQRNTHLIHQHNNDR